MPRFHCSVPLRAGVTLDLPAGVARHVQVLRLQPGDALTVFDGAGGEYDATVERMGRNDVSVTLGDHHAIEREAARVVHLVVGMPANERMDWLIEKATELGVASVQPLMTAHGVLRLADERADKKRAHWEAIAIASCEQCGRNRVPVIHAVRSFAAWLGAAIARAETAEATARFVLSLADGARPLAGSIPTWDSREAVVLSGPEGGLSPSEEREAIERGFVPVTLGTRVLRAETAALAALMSLSAVPETR